MPLSCSLLGHAYAFVAEDATLRWDCRRCGVPGGTKDYASAETAGRYAAAFESRGGSGPGPRMTPLGLIPYELVRRWRHRRDSSEVADG